MALASSRRHIWLRGIYFHKTVALFTLVSRLHYTYKIFLLEVYLEESGSEDVLECNDNYIITQSIWVTLYL